MNSRAGTFSRHHIPVGSQTGDGAVWLIGIAMALAITVVAALSLPSILILPAVAVGLYAASFVAVLATRRGQPDTSEKGWLLAGLLFVTGVVVSVASDLDGMVAYFG